MKTTGTFFLKKDNLQLGLVLGFVLPMLVFLLIYLVRFSDSTLPEFLQTFVAQKGLITFLACGAW